MAKATWCCPARFGLTGPAQTISIICNAILNHLIGARVNDDVRKLGQRIAESNVSMLRFRIGRLVLVVPS
jgi:hypothetical protein